MNLMYLAWVDREPDFALEEQHLFSSLNGLLNQLAFVTIVLCF